MRKPASMSCALMLVGLLAVPASGAGRLVSEFRITILSTMVTELRGVGEWGFSALVEVGDNRLLFDTGARPGTVLQNVQELAVDLLGIDNVVLSHHHWDHTGGLVALRRALRTQRHRALGQVHAGAGILLPRVPDETSAYRLPPVPPELLVRIQDVRDEYAELGGRFIVHDQPVELHPGVWITGPIPRLHPERNWTPFMRIQRQGKLVEDTIPEDQALVLDTPRGLVIVAGCGHAGIINTMEYARKITATDTVFAVIGGFHLMSLSDDDLDRTEDAGVRRDPHPRGALRRAQRRAWIA